MIYHYLNLLQNFLLHKVALYDHQIMKSIIRLKINNISKFAVQWVNGFINEVVLWGYKLASWLPWRKELFHIQHSSDLHVLEYLKYWLLCCLFAISKNYLSDDHSY